MKEMGNGLLKRRVRLGRVVSPPVIISLRLVSSCRRHHAWCPSMPCPAADTLRAPCCQDVRLTDVPMSRSVATLTQGNAKVRLGEPHITVVSLRPEGAAKAGQAASTDAEPPLVVADAAAAASHGCMMLDVPSKFEIYRSVCLSRGGRVVTDIESSLGLPRKRLAVYVDELLKEGSVVATRRSQARTTVTALFSSAERAQRWAQRAERVDGGGGDDSWEVDCHSDFDRWLRLPFSGPMPSRDGDDNARAAAGLGKESDRVGTEVVTTVVDDPLAWLFCCPCHVREGVGTGYAALAAPSHSCSLSLVG